MTLNLFYTYLRVSAVVITQTISIPLKISRANKIIH